MKLIRTLDIEYWMRNIEANADQNVNKVLVGNKCDAEDKRVVSTEQGQDMARRLGLPFYETSAKNSLKVDECFYQLARDIRDRLNEPGVIQQGGQQPSSVDLSSNDQNNAGGCCNLL